jgi:hypothetical protein
MPSARRELSTPISKAWQAHVFQELRPHDKEELSFGAFAISHDGTEIVGAGLPPEYDKTLVCRWARGGEGLSAARIEGILVGVIKLVGMEGAGIVAGSERNQRHYGVGLCNVRTGEVYSWNRVRDGRVSVAVLDQGPFSLAVADYPGEVWLWRRDQLPDAWTALADSGTD